MDITLPTIPTGILVVLAFFGPYAVGALNGALKFVTEPWQKKLVTIIVSIALAAAVILVYVGLGGSLGVEGWAALAVIAILVVAASYAFITKSTASALEDRVERAVQ